MRVCRPVHLDGSKTSSFLFSSPVLDNGEPGQFVTGRRPSLSATAGPAPRGQDRTPETSEAARAGLQLLPQGSGVNAGPAAALWFAPAGSIQGYFGNT